MNAIRLLGAALLALSVGTVAYASVNGDFHWSDADSVNLIASIENGDYGTVTSILVLLRGKPVFEHYANGADEATLHNTRSVTKTVTGMAVGLAIDDGFLKIDEPVARYFTDIEPFGNPDPRKQEITPQDLLTMSGPLECDDWNPFSRGNEERMYIVEDWSRFFWDLPVRGFPAWAPKTRSAPYDRAFSYCTAGIQILGELVGRATATPVTDYIEKELFLPLGIDAFKWPRNGAGSAHLGGGLELTTRGLARLAELQRNGGTHDGQQILSREWIRSSVTPRTAIPGTEWEYGYLWWLKSYPVGDSTYLAQAMNGNGGNRIMILPEFGVTVVITKTDYNSQDMHSKTDAFFDDEIFARLSTE
jgi:CubicO group peptidase (beta-lactamase class C family)